MKEASFNRGPGYCQMLYNKMLLDVLASAAAKKYDLIEPDVLGIIDGDTYWHTLPVKENVVDPAGHIILHTFDPTCNFQKGVYGKGVIDMLKADSDSFLNAMVQFSIHVWRESLSQMRQYVSELHGEGTTFLDVYMNTEASICEFCLMASYFHLHEADRYTVTNRPCPNMNKEYTSNLFRESTHGLPMVGTMQHMRILKTYIVVIAAGSRDAA